MREGACIGGATIPPNLIVSQGVCGESQFGEEVCMTLSVESETRGVRWVLKMSDIGEGQGCPLCKEGQDLVLQCSIRCEESKIKCFTHNTNAYIHTYLSIYTHTYPYTHIRISKISII